MGQLRLGGLFLLVCTLFGFYHPAVSQGDWIDFNNVYYKIPTYSDGVYRLNFASLSAAGINPNVIDPRDIRLYHRGREVAIRIQGEEDGKFDSQDFIDFFGRRNDGTLDAKLYKDPSHVGNTAYNLHNDSTAFFLTITPGVNGKRMAERAGFDLGAELATSYRDIAQRVYFENFHFGILYNPGVRLSDFEEGEGWTSAQIGKNNPRNFVLSELGQIPSLGTGTLEIGLTGRSETPHAVTISVGPNSTVLRELGTFTFNQMQAVHQSLPLAASDFNAQGQITVQVRTSGPAPTDNVSVPYIRLTYPRMVTQGDFNGQYFISDAGASRVQIDNALSSYTAFEVTDPENPILVPVSKTGNQITFPSGIEGIPSKVWVENQLDVKVVPTMQRVRFRNLLARKADFIVIGNRFLRRPAGTYSDPVAAYAAHRASPQGGGFDTLVVNIDDLYNQFSFGEKTPLAIYDFLKEYYPLHKPDYLFLIGRATGILSTARANNVTYFYRQNPGVFTFQDMVPPAGYPYADHNYGVGLDPENPMLSAIAIGRIPARTPDHVAAYLNKVKEKDALGVTEDWQKEIVHLAGGLSSFELSRYFNFLNGFKTIAEGPYLGGNVTTYRKRSNATIELIDISKEVNDGLSLVTFFGHAAPSIIDIEIGFASDPTMGYENKGKYPMLLLNGCDAGNSFGNAYTFGEDWVLTPDRGASNFMAHANTGVDVYLRRYSESFYTRAFADSSMIYQPVGLIRKEAEKWFYFRYGTSIINRSHAEQLVMLGDPAVKLFPANKADYALVEADVQLGGFDGDAFNALSDSLKLSFVLRNLGRVDEDSVEYRISRRLPDGTTINYPSVRMPAVFYRDTVHFTVPNLGVSAFGDNTFSLEVNPGRKIPEMTFFNNAVSVTRFVPLSGTIHLIPENYGIVHEAEIQLVAQIPGKSVEPRTVVIQLDSAANFSSPSRQETRLTSANLISWSVNLFDRISERDSMTFYWRSRFLDLKEGESDQWTTGSFSYIRNGPSGWTQREILQKRENQLDNLEIDPVKREWKYKDQKLNIEVFTFGDETDSLTFRNTQFYLEGVPYIIDNVNNANSRLCPNGSLGLVAFDQKSLTPYLVIQPEGFDILDGRTCGRVPQVIQSIRNSWITTPGQRLMLDYIDGLGAGDFVVIFTVGGVTFERWPDEAIESMKQVGANEAVLRNLKDGDPYILFGRKGMRPGEGVEIVGRQDLEVETNAQIVQFQTELTGYISAGSILTPRIGPASEWSRFFNQVNSRDWFDESQAYFDLIGVGGNGEEQVLFANVQETEIDLASVNPSQFPYLRLRYAMEDDSSTAPAILDRWQVNYTGVPEGVLVFKGTEEQVNLQEGKEFSLPFEFVNISTFDFADSLLVEWEYFNTTSKQTEKSQKKIPAIKAGESHAFTIDFNSIGKGGENRAGIVVNPRLQLEQTYRNNQMDLGLYFVVTPDRNTALLDVSFDGVYIMDGDIVSPTVVITSLLKNDKSFLLKKDTLGIELFLKRPCEECGFEKVNFSSPLINWSPATENSSFKVEYRPGPLADGIYTLRVATENPGTDKPYEVSFEVINEASISNFYPYPNPFSSSVRFVFTVTGAEVPDQIKIQIMTVSGRVVREILQDELGPIRIGNNISEYAWDGRDEFGDQLANGVYIYRVLVRKNGQFVELRGTAGDKAFRQGYGKMYLLR